MCEVAHACYVRTSAETTARFCPFAHVYVRELKPLLCLCLSLSKNTVRPRCHVSPYAQSTVALARGIFISLCVGLFIGSQALSQMCTATVPPAWVYGMLLLLLLFTNISPAESSYHKTSWPPNTMGTLSCKVRGVVISERETDWVNMVQGLAAEKEQLRSGVMYSAVSSQLSLVFVISVVSLWLHNLFISLLSCKTQRE